MPGAWADDLTPFFAIDEFATTATWTPKGGGASISGPVIFDAPTVNVLDNARSIDFSARAARTLWPAVREGDTVVVSGVTYRVRYVDQVDDGRLIDVLMAKV